MLGDGAEVYLPLFLAVSPLSFSWGILYTSLLHLRSPRPQQTSQKCLLATCHACSRHKLCANLPWETPFGEGDAWVVHRVAGSGRRVLGLSFLMDTYTVLARYRYIPPPQRPKGENLHKSQYLQMVSKHPSLPSHLSGLCVSAHRSFRIISLYLRSPLGGGERGTAVVFLWGKTACALGSSSLQHRRQ